MTVPQVLRRLDELRRRQQPVRGRRAGAGPLPASPPASRLPLRALRSIAETLGPRHDVAHALWNTGCPDARVLATLVEQPVLVEDAQLDRWILTSGEAAVADRVCLEVVVRTPWARSKVGDWAHHPQALVRRAAYVVLAALARTDHEMTDADFIPWVDAVPSVAPREEAGVRRAMLRALSAIAARNEALGQRVRGANARLRPDLPSAGGRPSPPVPLAWRRAG